MKNILKLINFFSNKDKIYLIFIFFSTFIVSIVETFSLGSVVGFVMTLADPESAIKVIPFQKLKFYLQSLKYHEFIIIVTISLIMIFILKNIFILTFQYFNLYIEKNIYVKLCQKLLVSYVNRPYIFHVENNSNKLINSVLSEVGRALSSIFQLFKIFRESLVLIFLFSTVIFINYKLFFIIILTMGLATFLFFISIKKFTQKLGLKQKYFSENRLKTLNEIFGLIKIIKLSNAADIFLKKFNELNMKRSSVENTNKFIGLIPRSFLELFAIITISMIIFFFIYYDYDFNNIIPTLTLLAVLLVRSIPALGIINTSFNFLQFQKHSLIFILKELESNQDNLEVSKRNKINLIKNISIKDLSFSYPNSSNKLFDRLNLNIRNNQFIGIIGPSGSGKSSLIDLLLGLYQPSRGEIIVDNIKNKILHKDFRDNIGYIPQDIYLVDDSIKKNIALGVKDADIDESKIYEILEILNLDKLVNKFEEKIEKKIGDRGIKISGGQKQRLGIARALYKNTQILIFDESTNALDFETENKIFEYLLNNKHNKIIIMINHRIQMLKKCDFVYEIMNGKCINKNKNEI